MTLDERTVRVQVLQVAGCPNADRALDTVAQALGRLGIDATVERVVGEYASPTVLVDGHDVTGRPAGRREASCRLDLPTEAQVLAAVRRAGRDDGGAPCTS
jgi:hypothetical protein